MFQAQTKIKEYIHDKGIKKRYVAEKAGIKNYRFSLILNNRSTMRADEFENICKALEVSPEKFIDWKK